ncbi:MAG: hypothetical protein ABIA93_03535 [Candidatus Woesearchaeota archaeon]
MSDVNITVSTRFLERTLYWVLIIGLGIGLFLTILDNHDLKQKIELGGGSAQAAAQQTAPSNDSGSTGITGAVTNDSEPKCTANIDCEIGYECTEGSCVKITPVVECNLHSDCVDKGALYKCRDSKCVYEPECTTNDDCDSGFECTKNKCVETTLSGEVELKVTEIQYLYDDAALDNDGNTRLRSFDLEITNGLSSSVDYTGLVWFVSKSHQIDIGSKNWKYGFEWDSDMNSLDLPVIKSGETYTKRVTLTHNSGDAGGNWPLAQITDGDRAYFEVRFYTDSDYASNNFDPEDTDYISASDDFVITS